MRLDRGLLVTGTDTGVGKTVVTAALAAALAEGGVSVRALKPVASGVAEGHPGEDAALIGAAAGHAPLSLLRFRTPVSPHRAAVLEGVDVDPAAILAWVHANAGDVTLVEGAGGWEVPFAADWRVSHLGVALGWPVLVVAADRLGVLNHTLLTVAAVQRAGLAVAAVVLTGPVEGNLPDSGDMNNHADLVRLLDGVAIRRMPWLASLDRASLAEAGRALLRGDGGC
ncbi:MAG: dethiobiotin synthase [Pseudomonadota bacterium]|nr:dethiobiotin synthase [Pseudomonadota bacterium]